MAVVTCPKCRTAVEVDESHLGAEVQCGQCDGVFTATATRPARARRDEDDDFDDHPRRRRRRSSDFEPDEGSYQDAMAAVRGPGLGMIWTGWLGILLYGFGGIAAVVFGFHLQGIAKNQDDREGAITMIVLGLIACVAGPFLSGFIAYGGHQMKGLRRKGMALAGAIIGIASVSICHPCNPLVWAGIGFGIWTIIALNKPVVKWAIARNSAGVDDRD